MVQRNEKLESSLRPFLSFFFFPSFFLPLARLLRCRCNYPRMYRGTPVVGNNSEWWISLWPNTKLTTTAAAAATRDEGHSLCQFLFRSIYQNECHMKTRTTNTSWPIIVFVCFSFFSRPYFLWCIAQRQPLLLYKYIGRSWGGLSTTGSPVPLSSPAIRHFAYRLRQTEWDGRLDSIISATQ